MQPRGRNETLELEDTEARQDRIRAFVLYVTILISQPVHRKRS
jgi:hypothetical protein